MVKVFKSRVSKIIFALPLLICSCDRTLPSDPLVILVPERIQTQKWIPRYVDSSFDFEMSHNLYDGLYNPKVTQGYEKSLAMQVLGVKSGSKEGREIVVKIRTDRSWVDSPTSEDTVKIDAHAVVNSWEFIQERGIPGRSRYKSAIQDIVAESEDTLRVTFKGPISLSRAALEVLSFRVFPVPPQRESIPKGSGAFFLGSISSREPNGLLLPSPHFRRVDGNNRPGVKLISILSARTRLDQVLEGKAHIATNIPPYYLRNVQGTERDFVTPKSHQTDPYNIWALAFNSRLNQRQRRELAARLDTESLLRAFLREDTNGPSTIWRTSEQKDELFSPTIFPSNYNVLTCMQNQMASGLLTEAQASIAHRLSVSPKNFNLSMQGEGVHAQLPKLMKVAFADHGSFSEGALEMARQVKRQIESDWLSTRVKLEAQSPSTYDRTIRQLALGESGADIVIVRLDYQRQCDVSRHFAEGDNPGIDSGLFSWILREAGGTTLNWDSRDLQNLRHQHGCDSQVTPSLNVIKAVHDLAPAKFLFRMPSLIVFNPQVDLGVHDEFALAGLRNWYAFEKLQARHD